MTKTTAVKALPKGNTSADKATAIIAEAVSSGVDANTLEKLLSMRKALKDEFAKEEYYKALSKFQSEVGVIEKKKQGGTTKAGRVAYYYAPLEDIMQVIKKPLAHNGLSVVFREEDGGNTYQIVCRVNHISGYSDATSVTMPEAPQTAVMSAMQARASTITFARRYALINALGLVVGGEDTEDRISGRVKGSAGITPEQIKLIGSLRKKTDGLESIDKNFGTSLAKTDQEAKESLLTLDAEQAELLIDELKGNQSKKAWEK